MTDTEVTLRLLAKADMKAWKAHHTAEDLLEDGHSRTCTVCGEPFVSRHNDAQYCSGKCKERKRRKKNRE
jgi:hypothetical protein